MFGPKIRNVFKSRWHALFWSASMLLTAYCSVPSPDEGGNANDAAQLAGTLAAHADKHPPAHRNPWALDKPAN